MIRERRCLRQVTIAVAMLLLAGLTHLASAITGGEDELTLRVLDLARAGGSPAPAAAVAAALREADPAGADRWMAVETVLGNGSWTDVRPELERRLMPFGITCPSAAEGEAAMDAVLTAAKGLQARLSPEARTRLTVRLLEVQWKTTQTPAVRNRMLATIFRAMGNTKEIIAVKGYIRGWLTGMPDDRVLAQLDAGLGKILQDQERRLKLEQEGTDILEQAKQQLAKLKKILEPDTYFERRKLQAMPPADMRVLLDEKAALEKKISDGHERLNQAYAIPEAKEELTALAREFGLGAKPGAAPTKEGAQ